MATALRRSTGMVIIVYKTRGGMFYRGWRKWVTDINEATQFGSMEEANEVVKVLQANPFAKHATRILAVEV